MSGYTTRDISQILGLSPAKVRAFAKAGIVSPERGPRSAYRFGFEDVVILRAAKELADADISSREIWRALRDLRSQLPRGRSLASLRIVAEGDRVVARDGESAWNPHTGQLQLSFAVSEVAGDAALVTRRAARRASQNRDLTSEDWYELGVDLETVGALEDAKLAYLSALELDAKNVDAHVNYGRMVQAEGSLDEAERHYREALGSSPDNPTAAFNLGTLCEEGGRPREALEAYRTAVRALPDFADAHFNISRVYEKLGDRQGALRHLTRYRSLTAC